MKILKDLAPFSLLLVGFLTAPVVAKDTLACVAQCNIGKSDLCNINSMKMPQEKLMCIRQKCSSSEVQVAINDIVLNCGANGMTVSQSTLQSLIYPPNHQPNAVLLPRAATTTATAKPSSATTAASPAATSANKTEAKSTATTAPATDKNKSGKTKEKKKKGMSAGALTGILVAIIIIVLLVLLVAVICMLRRKKQKKSPEEAESHHDEEADQVPAEEHLPPASEADESEHGTAPKH
ncbi:hypothetical protein BZA77DRAFT_385033 [Pyronema omphalodes]|nr:hypothetical protein BZA77DRAFT_385033 [Pyronema omphalodes]